METHTAPEYPLQLASITVTGITIPPSDIRHELLSNIIWVYDRISKTRGEGLKQQLSQKLRQLVISELAPKICDVQA